jgi:hypothetical protein
LADGDLLGHLPERFDRIDESAGLELPRPTVMASMSRQWTIKAIKSPSA